MGIILFLDFEDKKYFEVLTSIQQNRPGSTQ